MSRGNLAFEKLQSTSNHHIAIYWLLNHRLTELNLGRLSEERSDCLPSQK